jgi:hypothetical protein
MTFNKIPGPPIVADYALSHPTPALCRGRFIVPIADLSALLRLNRSPSPCNIETLQTSKANSIAPLWR